MKKKDVNKKPTQKLEFTINITPEEFAKACYSNNAKVDESLSVFKKIFNLVDTPKKENTI